MPRVLYFTRSHTVLGSSLWNYWYTSKVFKSIFGFVFTHGYMLGVSAGDAYIVRSYKDDGELQRMKDVALTYVRENPEKALKLLQKGFKMQQDIILGDFEIDMGCNIETVLESYAEVALYTAVLPYFWFNETDIAQTEYHHEIQNLCMRLRETTVYPLLYEQKILPWLSAYTGVSQNVLSRVTYSDLLKKDFNIVEIKIGKCFEYTYEGGVEHVVYIDRGAVIEKVINIEGFKFESVVSGTVVSRGQGAVCGVARVVGLDMSTFSNDEILVVPSLSNVHVPLFKKAKAVLCEEGGSAAHAAFLKDVNIPVITNLKNITLLVTDGEKVLVEPDQYRVHLRYE